MFASLLWKWIILSMIFDSTHAVLYQNAWGEDWVIKLPSTNKTFFLERRSRGVQEPFGGGFWKRSKGVGALAGKSVFNTEKR